MGERGRNKATVWRGGRTGSGKEWRNEYARHGNSNEKNDRWKAMGEDKISTEIMRAEGLAGYNRLYRVLRDTRKERIIPEDWR